MYFDFAHYIALLWSAQFLRRLSYKHGAPPEHFAKP